MKKVVVMMMLIWAAAAFSFGQETIKWYTINEAVELNKKAPRVFIVDVYTDWCGWCKRMDANTFSNPVIAAYINKNYYPVKLNAEQKDDIILEGRTYKFIQGSGRGYNELAAILLRGKLSYPSIVYLNPKLQIIDVVAGYKTPQQLEVYLSYFKEGAYARTTLTEYAQTFRGELTPPSTALDAL